MYILLNDVLAAKLYDVPAAKGFHANDKIIFNQTSHNFVVNSSIIIINAMIAYY